MNLDQYFSLKRFWLLLKLEVFKARGGILMVLVITLGALFFIGMILSLLVEEHVIVFQHDDGYSSSLIIAGCILSSLAFNDLGNSLKRHNFLSLPVSVFERLLCMWLLTTVGWVVMYSLIYTIYTWLANPIGHLMYNKVTFQSFDPFSENAWNTIKYYFVIQGIFLVGASHFRGYVFPKTLVIIILFGMVVGILTYFFLKDIFLGEHFCSDVGVECELVDALSVHYVWYAIRGFFWWLLMPLSLVLTYFGLRGQRV